MNCRYRNVVQRTLCSCSQTLAGYCSRAGGIVEQESEDPYQFCDQRDNSGKFLSLANEFRSISRHGKSRTRERRLHLRSHYSDWLSSIVDNRCPEDRFLELL